MTPTAARLAAQELLEIAEEAFPDDEAHAILLEARVRLDEPLRVAIAGMVKAGKSTLLNALIGDAIAPSDAGESTRVVTWYRYGRTPTVHVHPREGRPIERPVRRVAGRLADDLAGLDPADVERVEVAWPLASLREMTLIDTPGIASLTTATAEGAARESATSHASSEADAIVYLLRHLHEADLRFLEALADAGAGAAGGASVVNAVAVLARADEVGSGRIDAMLSAHEIAARYRRDGALRSRAVDIVPMAGLLAVGARSLRQWEFDALLELSRLERDEREGLLMSVDRFTSINATVVTTPRHRAELLERFGVFGIRCATALLRGGAIASSSELAGVLRVQSGLDELLGAISTFFTSRADELKARAVARAVGNLARRRTESGSGGTSPEALQKAEGVAALLERMAVNDHDATERGLLASLRTSGIGLEAGAERQAARILGASGNGVRERLDLPADASDRDAAARARELASEWRARASDPRFTRAAAIPCEAIARSAEGQLAHVAPRDASGETRRTRLALGAEPID